MMTMGDLSRRFERDREFSAGQVITGPAVTPAGNDNGDMSLRFGVFEPKSVPREMRLPFRFSLLIGKDAALWAELSTYAFRWAVSWRKFSLVRKR